MRRSATFPPAIDAALLNEARKRNSMVGDVIVDAVAYFCGLSVPKDVLRARKVFIHDAQQAKQTKVKSAITRTRRQKAILDALSDPERSRILDQLMGVLEHTQRA